MVDSVRLLVESPLPNSLLVLRVLQVEHDIGDDGTSLPCRKRADVVPKVILYQNHVATVSIAHNIHKDL